jgi:hypothetical protein
LGAQNCPGVRHKSARRRRMSDKSLGNARKTRVSLRPHRRHPHSPVTHPQLIDCIAAENGFRTTRECLLSRAARRELLVIWTRPPWSGQGFRVAHPIVQVRDGRVDAAADRPIIPPNPSVAAGTALGRRAFRARCRNPSETRIQCASPLRHRSFLHFPVALDLLVKREQSAL